MAHRRMYKLAHDQRPGESRVHEGPEDASPHRDSEWHYDRRSCNGHRLIEADGRRYRGILYTPEVEGSLISVSKLAEKDVVTQFSNDKCVFRYGDMIVMEAKRYGNIYRGECDDECIVCIIASVKAGIAEKFLIKDLGRACFILGIKIDYDVEAKTLRISKQAYTELIIKKFRQENAKLCSTRQELVYIGTNTEATSQLDLQFLDSSQCP